MYFQNLVSVILSLLMGKSCTCLLILFLFFNVGQHLVDGGAYMDLSRPFLQNYNSVHEQFYIIFVSQLTSTGCFSDRVLTV